MFYQAPTNITYTYVGQPIPTVQISDDAEGLFYLLYNNPTTHDYDTLYYSFGPTWNNVSGNLAGPPHPYGQYAVHLELVSGSAYMTVPEPITAMSVIVAIFISSFRSRLREQN
jgi:hypothetical protein